MKTLPKRDNEVLNEKIKAHVKRTGIPTFGYQAQDLDAFTLQELTELKQHGLISNEDISIRIIRNEGDYMKLSALEQKRLARVSASARQAINDLNIKADRLYARGNDESRAKANVLYQESDRLYVEQVLNRKFN